MQCLDTTSYVKPRRRRASSSSLDWLSVRLPSDWLLHRKHRSLQDGEFAVSSHIWDMDVNVSKYLTRLVFNTSARHRALCVPRPLLTRLRLFLSSAYEEIGYGVCWISVLLGTLDRYRWWSSGARKRCRLKWKHELVRDDRECDRPTRWITLAMMVHFDRPWRLM